PGNQHDMSADISHIPGRWLNALFNAQEVVGVRLDENIVESLARWTYRAFTHPTGLPQSIDWVRMKVVPDTSIHNLRESMHALFALVKYRKDKRALKLARQQIKTVEKYLDFRSARWDERSFRRERCGKCDQQWGIDSPRLRFPMGFGRYIGPLVKLYRASGYEPALTQAIKLKDYAFKEVLNEKGDYDLRRFGNHTHSTTAMISSLAQLAEVLGDAPALERVKAFLENGLARIALPFGWCIETYKRKDHRGESNNTGDILEACLILGRAGFTEYFQQAERILRSHLLPSQLLDTRFIPNSDCPQEDHRHRLATRSRGAFGFPRPYGHEDHYAHNPRHPDAARISFNWDITGGAVGSLCEAYRDVVTHSGALTSINMHFDHTDSHLDVKSPYTNRDIMVVKLKRRRMLRVRLSNWVDRKQLRLTVNDKRTPMLISGDWLYLPVLNSRAMVKLKIPMKVVTTPYRFRKSTFVFRWRGDGVEAASNLSPRLCFFKAL
ncbi:MAG: hypothetical protein QF435_16615, partial [Arenicellales bacterium]|nr:hypothetical protein [Arenicellales bacterium]